MTCSTSAPEYIVLQETKLYTYHYSIMSLYVCQFVSLFCRLEVGRTNRSKVAGWSPGRRRVERRWAQWPCWHFTVRTDATWMVHGWQILRGKLRVHLPSRLVEWMHYRKRERKIFLCIWTQCWPETLVIFLGGEDNPFKCAVIIQIDFSFHFLHLDDHHYLY